jgi:hypothetical protein
MKMGAGSPEDLVSEGAGVTGIQDHIREIRLMVAQGSPHKAMARAQALVQTVPDSAEAFDLLMRLRADQFAAQQADAARAALEQSRHAATSLGQLLVRDVLRDPALADPRRLERFGYTTASQNEEDGMLAEVFRRIGTANRRFFEFGVGNGLQNNTLHFLFQGWGGAWIEINQPKLGFMRQVFAGPVAKGRLQLIGVPASAENIDQLVRTLALPEDLDLLSIDIDGNDWHVWKALTAIRPRVVVIEYNARFPPPIRIVQDYDPAYAYAATTHIGASLQSFADLGAEKGYRLVGCSVSGINAVFVRADLAGDLFAEPATAEALYHPPRLQLYATGAFGTVQPSHFPPHSNPEPAA